MTHSEHRARQIYMRGVKLAQAGRQAEAAPLFAEAAALDPTLAEAHNALGMLALQSGDAPGALPHFTRAAEIRAGNGTYHVNLGVTLRRLKRFGEARAAYDRAIALDPHSALVHSNRGNVCRDLGDNVAALADYDRAIALDADYAEAHYNRGVLLQKLGRLDEALVSLSEATRARPHYVDAWNSRGNVLRDLGRWDDAVAEYDRAIEAARAVPDAAPGIAADAHFNRAAVRRDQGDAAGAAADLAAALEIRPDFVQARWARAFCTLTPVYESSAAMDQAQDELPGALESLREAMAAGTAPAADWEPAVGSSQPFYLAYQRTNVRDALATSGRLACTVMEAWQASTQVPIPPAPGPRAGERRLRVGFVSSHVHRHSVWDVITRGWLTRLDRSRFDVTCFYAGWRRDRETALARSASGTFLMGTRSLEEWVRLIAASAPDVLIYPEIGMDPMTTKLAALRLAPVQCTAWGHPVTSGLPTQDYYLSAALLEPEGAAEHYTERLVRLPHLGCWFEPLGVGAVEPGPAAASRNEADGVPRFICCQQVAKYHPAHDEVYVRIARELGRCRFTFVELGRTHGAWARFRARLEGAFADRGLRAADYCVFIPTLPRKAFLQLLLEQDVYLDTLSFSGFTTAIQALSCAGLPIVTCAGEFLRSRLAAGILQHIGVTGTIARDADAYVALAVQLARNPDLRVEVRRQVTANLARAYRDDEVIRALEDFLGGVVVS